MGTGNQTGEGIFFFFFFFYSFISCPFCQCQFTSFLSLSLSLSLSLGTREEDSLLWATNDNAAQRRKRQSEREEEVSIWEFAEGEERKKWQSGSTTSTAECITSIASPAVLLHFHLAAIYQLFSFLSFPFLLLLLRGLSSPRMKNYYWLPDYQTVVVVVVVVDVPSSHTHTGGRAGNFKF